MALHYSMYINCTPCHHSLCAKYCEHKMCMSQGNWKGESAVAAILEGELLYLQIFSLLSPPRNIIQHVLAFSHGLKSCAYLAYCMVVTCGKDNLHRPHWIIASNPEVHIFNLHAWPSKWLPSPSIIVLHSGQNETWFPTPLKFLGMSTQEWCTNNFLHKKTKDTHWKSYSKIIIL